MSSASKARRPASRKTARRLGAMGWVAASEDAFLAAEKKIAEVLGGEFEICERIEWLEVRALLGGMVAGRREVEEVCIEEGFSKEVEGYTDKEFAEGVEFGEEGDIE